MTPDEFATKFKNLETHLRDVDRNQLIATIVAFSHRHELLRETALKICDKVEMAEYIPKELYVELLDRAQ